MNSLRLKFFLGNLIEILGNLIEISPKLMFLVPQISIKFPFLKPFLQPKLEITISVRKGLQRSRLMDCNHTHCNITTFLEFNFNQHQAVRQKQS